MKRDRCFVRVEWAILADAAMGGLVVACVKGGSSQYFATKRLEKYWSEIFGGEPLPRPGTASEH